MKRNPHSHNSAACRADFFAHIFVSLKFTLKFTPSISPNIYMLSKLTLCIDRSAIAHRFHLRFRHALTWDFLNSFSLRSFFVHFYISEWILCEISFSELFIFVDIVLIEKFLKIKISRMHTVRAFLNGAIVACVCTVFVSENPRSFTFL